jgi:gamma-glutamylcyclotransferase (GGCT)/AIG2-like uncharacterized protein YtfP
MKPDRVFVYGTLKRGQSRENCWPRKPLTVEPATVRGTLYDLGPYPGLTDGNDLVAGELWQFAAQDMAGTLAALDQVEGYRDQDEDEYRRVILQCAVNQKRLTAWAYHYARPGARTVASKIRPDNQGICRWPASFPMP